MRRILFPLVLFTCAEVLAQGHNLQKVVHPSAFSRPGPGAPAPADAALIRHVQNGGPGGLCLDAEPPMAGRDGSRVQLSTCNGQPRQGWLFSPLGNDWWTIRNHLSGQCLDGDVKGMPQSGAGVQLWNCNGWDNQKWHFDGQHFRNGRGWQCLDGDLFGLPSDGTRTQLWVCNGWPNQAWMLSQ